MRSKWLLAVLLALAGPAFAAEIGGTTYGTTTTASRSGMTTRMVTFCEDAGANGGCDGSSAGRLDNATTLPGTGHWTAPLDCRGAKQVAVHLGQNTLVVGNTNAYVFNCRTGWDRTIPPGNVLCTGASTPYACCSAGVGVGICNTRYCQDITTRFASGPLTDVSQDMYPQPWAGAQFLVGLFSCTTNCEAGQLEASCSW